MKDVHCIEFHTGSREERIPELAKDFPYTASRATLDRYIGSTVPWHWHQAVELFYMESGCVEYTTPGGKLVFPAGSGGFVNSNVLHTTRAISQTEENVQLLHIFDVSLLAGERGSRIEQKYILPITSDAQLEILPLLPDHAAGREILKRLKESFCLSCDTFGYELKLREILTELWLMLVEQSHSVSSSNRNSAGGNDKIKLMLIYIHEHYPENLSVKELAAAAYTSERECYRIFREHLHTTPIAYLTAYRIQIACQMTFVSIGNAPCSIIVAILRKFVLLIPLIFILPHILPDRTMAVYTAEPVADTLAVIFTMVMFGTQFRKALKKLEEA